MRSGPVLATLLAVFACTDGAGPETPLVLGIDAMPRTVTAGDSILFTASAKNTTSETIDLNSGCGSSLDVIVTSPGGEIISLYMVELNGRVPTCERRWYHDAEPGELIELEFFWEAPQVPGTYRALTEIRCHEEECQSSEAINVTVR